MPHKKSRIKENPELLHKGEDLIGDAIDKVKITAKYATWALETHEMADTETKFVFGLGSSVTEDSANNDIFFANRTEEDPELLFKDEFIIMDATVKARKQPQQFSGGVGGGN